MLKFQRNYRIEFEIGKRDQTLYYPEEIIEVKYPTSLQLDVQRGIFSSANTGKFQLYNLSPEIQRKLWKNRFDFNKYVSMKLYAGYGDVMPLIFYGDFSQCYSYRKSGSTDFITDIQANDMMYLFNTGFANCTASEGTTFENLLKALLADNLPKVDLGFISPKIPPLKSNQTFLGQTIELLRQEFSNYQIFIDNGQIHVIDTDEVLPGDIQVISADTGLLGSPEVADRYLNASMIFEPGLKMAQAITLISDTLPFVNNTYKLIALKHSGMISPVKCGKLTTTATFFYGETAFKELKKTSPTYGAQPTTGVWKKPVQNARVSSPFGYRQSPTAGASTNHKGLDLAVPLNTQIIAPANGSVFFARNAGGYGKCIQMDNGIINGKRITTLFGHLNRIDVKEQMSVLAGMPIGLVGQTGTATGPHLHFEVRENGVPVNPTKYIGKF